LFRVQCAPGWNTYVKEKQEAAREAFLIWMDFGKPRFGPYFESMKGYRAVFKLELRYSKNHIDELTADACAESLLDNDCRKFLNKVYKISSKKTTSHVNSAGGASGQRCVADMWKVHFELLYNPAAGSKYRAVFESKLRAYPLLSSACLLAVDDDVSAVSKQKHDQVPGLDGIRMEAFIFACRQLGLYLNILFNLCLKYGYVPDVFNRLVRCKTSDLADVNYYMAIALSNAV
jgi:hypothetical protein